MLLIFNISLIISLLNFYFREEKKTVLFNHRIKRVEKESLENIGIIIIGIYKSNCVFELITMLFIDSIFEFSPWEWSETTRMDIGAGKEGRKEGKEPCFNTGVSTERKHFTVRMIRNLLKRWLKLPVQHVIKAKLIQYPINPEFTFKRGEDPVISQLKVWLH